MNPKNVQKKNFGFKPPIITPSDFWLGSQKLGSKIINPSGNWIKFLPQFEKQNRGFETNSCVSEAITSALEMIHKLLWATEPNHSARFLAKISETDPYGGNTPKNVVDTAKHSGLVDEKVWPHEGTKTIEEYYKDIPVAIKEIGKKWLQSYGIGYEWVATDKLKIGLKRSPIPCAVDAWKTNDKGEYVRTGPSNHYCVLVGYYEPK